MDNTYLGLKTLEVSAFQQNCRIIYNLELCELLCIDPGSDAEFITATIKETFSSSKLSSAKIILTHAHIDHAGGIKDLIKCIEEEFSIKATLHYHKDCEAFKDSIELQAEMYGLSKFEYKNVPNADSLLEDETFFDYLGTNIKILLTPGHAPGHVSLFFKEGTIQDTPVVVGGDALFRQSIGRTDLPGGNHAQLLKSIRDKLFTLPDSTIVMCGHGPDTTIGHEKSFNPYLRS